MRFCIIQQLEVVTQRLAGACSSSPAVCSRTAALRDSSFERSRLHLTLPTHQRTRILPLPKWRRRLRQGVLPHKVRLKVEAVQCPHTAAAAAAAAATAIAVVPLLLNLRREVTIEPVTERIEQPDRAGQRPQLLVGRAATAVRPRGPGVQKSRGAACSATTTA